MNKEFKNQVVKAVGNFETYIFIQQNSNSPEGEWKVEQKPSNSVKILSFNEAKGLIEDLRSKKFKIKYL